MIKVSISPRHSTLIFWRIIILIFIVTFSLSSVGSADHPAYGPRLEIGGGLTANWPQSRPDWAVEIYNGGVVTAAFRVYEGFSIHAAQIYTIGSAPDADWIDYGENKRIKLNKKSLSEHSRIGVRYEIPMSLFNVSPYGIDFTYISLSMNYREFFVTSDSVESDGAVNKLEGEKKYKLADVSGPSVALAARWRFDTVESVKTKSWFGAVGADIGVRYTSYTDSEVKFDTITKPVSGFNTVEVFVVGFFEFKLLY